MKRSELTTDMEWIARLESKVVRLKIVRNRLLEACQFVADSIEVPEPNCSCHINPPCSDCVDNGSNREIIATVREAIAQAEHQED